MSKRSKAGRRKKMQERAIEEPKLDNARRLRGVYFIVPGDVEFHQKNNKNLRKKLEVPMEAAMPCKIRKTKCKGTCAGPDIRSSRYACIVEANDSTRKRLEGTQHKDYEELIASKGFNSLSHLQSCAQVHPFVSRTENTRSESRSGQIMEKLEDLPAWQLTKVRSKKRSFRRHTEKEEQSISLHWWTFVISRIRSWSRNFNNTMAEWYSEVTSCKTIQALTQYSQSKVRLHQN